MLCVSSCWCWPPQGDREVCREWTNPAIHGQRTGRINRAMHHSCSNQWCVADCIYWLIDCIDCLNWWKVQRQQTDAQRVMHNPQKIKNKWRVMLFHCMSKGAFHSKTLLFSSQCIRPVSPADHKCLVVNLYLQHISQADIISFKLSTYSNGLVVYLGMYVAFPVTANSLWHWHCSSSSSGLFNTPLISNDRRPRYSRCLLTNLCSVLRCCSSPSLTCITLTRGGSRGKQSSTGRVLVTGNKFVFVFICQDA